MWQHAVLFVDVALHESMDDGDAVWRVEEESLMVEEAPPSFEHGVRELQLCERQDPAQDARGNEFVDLCVHVLDARVRQDDQGGV